MAEASATVSERRRISKIWVVPIVALVLGLWMVLYTLQTQGPEVTIVFSTAEGIEAGKTRIKLRSVEVGLVESAGLGDDMESVVVKARIDKAAAPLLRDDTQFWVVRPRIGKEGVSGIGTLLSGGYIQLAPGSGREGRREFVGREEPPVTPAGTPGLSLRLTSDRAGSVGTGDAVLYKGFRVGRVESSEFEVESQRMHYGVFIEAPYDDLLTSSTRFWNASGFSLSTTADGVELHTGSLETILSGGVAFGLPEGMEPGSPLESGAAFELYPDYKSVNARPYRHGLHYVVDFEQSVRGLRPGAPVEYRGLPVGRVERILLQELVADGLTGEGTSIPVLLRLEPGRLELPDSEVGVKALRDAISSAVSNGFRASLATGSLLTGSLYVTLDMYPDAEPAVMGEFAGHPTIPSVASGLEGIQQQVFALLEKLNALPLEDVADSAAQAVAHLEALMASRELQALPASLEATMVELERVLASVSDDSLLQERLGRTLGELERTLESLQAVLGTLEDQPSSVLFPREPELDPEPPAGSQ